MVKGRWSPYEPELYLNREQLEDLILEDLILHPEKIKELNKEPQQQPLLSD